MLLCVIDFLLIKAYLIKTEKNLVHFLLSTYNK